MAAWYGREVYGRLEGAGCLPFYCDPRRVGSFAVKATSLAEGEESTLFKLLVMFALYQSRRDVDIMALQKAMSQATVRTLTDPKRLRVLVDDSRCERFDNAIAFDTGCSVRRDIGRDRARCDHRPRTTCHVKDASLAIRRMGDMGKIPTSAFLHIEQDGGFRGILRQVVADVASPRRRADDLVKRLSLIYRIGTKLATMFVSALSTPELAPSLTPWAPMVDGSHLIVVDANVSRVISLLDPRVPTHYATRARWFGAIASKIDLTRIRSTWPRTSPRLVQQAAYSFRSRSNRVANGDRCQERSEPCKDCLPEVCPFVSLRDHATVARSGSRPKRFDGSLNAYHREAA